MIHRIRERHAFERLAHEGSRIRCSALWCTWCPDPDSTSTQIAYAFGRAFGPATQRNRIRRQLRALLTEIDRATPLPTGILMIGGSSKLSELTFEQLSTLTGDLVTKIRSHRSNA